MANASNLGSPIFSDEVGNGHYIRWHHGSQHRDADMLLAKGDFRRKYAP